MRWAFAGFFICCFISGAAAAAEKSGNRLTYLDRSDPYYVGTGFPKFTTPQWVGEEGVEAVVILAIDDMREPAKYEEFLRPILQRLKKIDGRAPVSIMTCNVKPDDPQLRAWLDEGLSLEVHTIDHPCPLLKDDDLAKAKSTYDRCVDLMYQIPGNKPVAFRMPCCDSLNTVSPRFYSEIFRDMTPADHYLRIDSSVMNVFTDADKSIPRELLVDADGKPKFKKYVPADRLFVNTIENYPYPYQIKSGLCWEFPCVAPSDWSAQHYHNEKCSPATVRDWKAALNITVLKQGVMNLIFHPHGWIRSDQIVELIDHAVEKYGKKVKFLTFSEAAKRLHLLQAHEERHFGNLLVDFNNDGYLDLWGGHDGEHVSLWSPTKKAWANGKFPDFDYSEILGIIHKGGELSALREASAVWTLLNNGWKESNIQLPENFQRSLHVSTMRDLNGDGICELFCYDGTEQPTVTSKAHILQLSDKGDRWTVLPFSLPKEVDFWGSEGFDSGLHFIDINEDGYDDIVFSNAERYSIHLFESMKTGWSKELLAGERGKKDPKDELPPIVNKDGSDNGFWVHSRSLVWQNEHTAKLKDLVDRRSFDDLMKKDSSGSLGPKSPEDSLKAIVVRPGFTVELVASEPLVRDPVAFEWGADGKLWVVEMADYPVGMDGKGKPGGRIRVLEDTDGDGKYDHAKLFLDGLSFPNGVMPWKNGVLITAAPDIIYAEDTDGDGDADRQEVLYTGFGQGNQQHRVNGLVWGLDNWIYCANGDSGGRVQSTKTGETINIGGRDLRIRPETGQIDPQLGSTQFGRNRDDWGNWFGNNNAYPMWQYVLEDHYLRRNPHVVPNEGRKAVSVKSGPVTVYPISRTLARFNDLHMLNHFTSACSAMVYRDELFGPEFSNSTFVSEPVHNLVHREAIEADGLTFKSRRADDEKESEFLASRDNWFRPTMLKTGPDGAIYIADMYRKVIEHTQYIPTELQKGLDVRAGDDKGRIYRVFPTGAQLRRVPNLRAMKTEELVAAIDSPNGWQRDTVQKLLIERHDASAVTPLDTIVHESDRPLARMQALCTLDGMGRLTPATIIAGLADEHPGVRRHALRLCEPMLNIEPEVGKAMLKLLDDRDPHVCLQLACSLGEWNNKEASRALGKLALDHADDRYVMAAVISSTNAGNVDAVLEAAASTTAQSSSQDNAILARMLSLAAAVGNQDVLKQIFGHIKQPREGRGPKWQYTALANVLDALDRRKSSGGQNQALTNALNEQLGGSKDLFDEARKTAADEKADEDLRIAAIRVLARSKDNRDTDIALLGQLLGVHQSGSLQSAAADRLGEINDDKVPGLLISEWKAFGPRLRSKVVDALLGRTRSLELLVDAMEDGRVPPSEFDAARRASLLHHRSQRIRARAEKLFAGAISADRQKVLADYQTSLTREPNLGNGKVQFEKVCSTCHKLEGAGHEVGPDLVSVKDKSPESMLVAILDPNRSVESKYINYMAVTNAGKTHSGVLANETGESITLLAPKGERTSLLRSELEILQSTSKSTMPEGLEKDLKPQDVADVMAYVRQAGTKRVPSNQPGRFPRGVRPDKDGSLLLTAAECEIYGDTLVLEKQNENLGFWKSGNDRAIWPISVTKEGRYEVWAHWACEAQSAGGKLTISCGKSQLTVTVESTGDWNTYKSAKLGEIDLAEGAQRMIAQAEGTVKGALIDLKSLRLVPMGENAPDKQ